MNYNGRETFWKDKTGPDSRGSGSESLNGTGFVNLQENKN